MSPIEKKWQTLSLEEVRRRGLAQSGSCIVCLSGTDTALAVQGNAEWILAMQMNITGDDQQLAHATLAQMSPEEWGNDKVPASPSPLFVTLCEDCAVHNPKPGPFNNRTKRTHPLKVALAINGAPLPTYRPPID